jgi:hypothetical protein
MADDGDLRPEYPSELIRSGVRGKYAEWYRERTNIVVIEPELSEAFPNTKAVNDALRQILASRKQADA